MTGAKREIRYCSFPGRDRKNLFSCALFFSLLPFFLASSAPVLVLAAVVLSWNGGQSILGVVGGLVFSAVGDCCLVWPELFLHGMGAFAVAHLLYSFSFLTSRYAAYSSSSWSRFLYLILLVTAGGFYTYLYPFLKKDPESDILVPAVGVYVALITLMGALAVRTRRALTLLGSLFFMLSDMSLALQVFKVMPPMKQGNIVVMVTYYLAQLLIAVGDIKATETTEDFSKWKAS
uniref:lysoplasmalogenase n=1 Tax=Takifugu rubripes TaxID=31033 RepID=A0A3B5JYB4_TAKRU